MRRWVNVHGAYVEDRDAGYRHSARLLKPFVRVMRGYPELPQEALEQLAATDVDDWIPFSHSVRCSEVLVDELRDANLGLHAAERLVRGDFDVLEFAARSCANFEEAIEVINRYVALLREGASYKLEQVGDRCIWSLSMAVPMPRVLNDWIVGSYVLLSRTLTEEPGLFTEIQVTHPEPHDTSEYERILRVPVKFGREQNRLVFPRQALSLGIKEADARLNAVMRRYAGDLLEHRPHSQHIRDLVRQALIETLRSPHSATSAIARKLQISVRTLNRRLSLEGIRFMTLYDDTRRDLALRYLRQPDLSIAEVAFLVGFSHAPAFSRAFKRWTGVSPINYRKHQRGQLLPEAAPRV